MKRLLRYFHYGEKGFTLIELLVVIAILGVLAAVIVPNVSRFMGKGTHESALTELHNVQTAVTAMMADQNPPLSSVTGTATATQDMSTFPDAATPIYNFPVTSVRYVQKEKTEWWYTCDDDGTVHGWATDQMQDEIGVDNGLGPDEL